MKESIMNFRIDENLKKAFEKIAEDRDLTTSQMLRAFIREEIEKSMKTNQKGLFEEKGKGNKKSVIPNTWRAK